MLLSWSQQWDLKPQSSRLEVNNLRLNAKTPVDKRKVKKKWLIIYK